MFGSIFQFFRDKSLIYYLVDDYIFTVTMKLCNCNEDIVK